METFKAWKELIKAVKGISSAIEGENSEGGSTIKDDANYLVRIGSSYGLVNKNLDTTKLAFDVEEFIDIKPKKVGDLFTQEGVDIINSMLSNEIIKRKPIEVFVFFKDTSEGDLLYPIVKFEFGNDKYIIRHEPSNTVASTSNKFTLDTPMSKEGLA